MVSTPTSARVHATLMIEHPQVNDAHKHPVVGNNFGTNDDERKGNNTLYPDVTPYHAMGDVETGVPIDGGHQNHAENAYMVEPSTAPSGFFASRKHSLFKGRPRIYVIGLKLLLPLQLLLMFAGLSIFLAFYVEGYLSTTTTYYEYSSPLTSMWIGIGLMWFSTINCAWWIFLCKTFTIAGHIFWMFLGGVLIIMGSTCMISFAASKNEGTAAGLSVLWILAGVVSFCMSLLWKMHGSEGARKPSWCQCRKCCCSLREWLVGFIFFVMLWWAVFTLGFSVNAAVSASDYNKYLPLGDIYDVTLGDGNSVRMHLYCVGSVDGTRPTIVFEHGGGSNCLSLKAIADTLASQGRRTCIYDRLGYGWTPSLISREKNSLVPSTGELLVSLLAEAGESERSSGYVCVGHSAGAGTCIDFARVSGNVVGITMLDGYPDLIRAGSWRPGQKSQDMVLKLTEIFGVMLGPTGLLRGTVGAPGSSFVPNDKIGAIIALYAQARFWYAQYVDVRAELNDSDKDSLLWGKMGGSADGQGLVTYGKTLNSTVLFIPAFNTVNMVCNSLTSKDVPFCCGESVKNWQMCKNFAEDRSLYNQQIDLYITTLSAKPGYVVTAPEGTDHDFPYQKDTYLWVVDQIVKYMP